MNAKKTAILSILEILKKYSDVDNKLSHKEIKDYLERDYDMVLQRKTIRENINELISMNENIEYDETIRKSKDGMEDLLSVRTNFYYSHDFSDEELIYLIHTMQNSMVIPFSNRMEIIKKLENLSSIHFRKRKQSERVHCTSAENNSVTDNENEKRINRQYLLNIALLDEAIHEGKKINFYRYPIDKENTWRGEAEVVSPYWIFQLWDDEVLYYCDDYDKKLRYVFIRRMYDICILDETVVSKEEAEWDSLRHYLTEVLVMSDEGELVTFRVDRKTYNERFRRAFSDYNIADSDIKREYSKVTITAKVKEELMIFWSLFYGLEIIEPVSYRKKVRRKMQELWNLYD